MCGCSSNFDGFNELDELEVSPYLDFDGEDMSIDEDFDDFWKKGSLKEAMRRKVEQRKENLLDKAKLTTDYDSCLRKKPLGARRINWKNACSTAHPNSVSAGSNPAVKDTPQQIGGTSKSPIGLGSMVSAIKESAISKAEDLRAGAEAEAGAEAGAGAEPKKAGLFAGKKAYIIGGVLILGLGIFAMARMRRS